MTLALYGKSRQRQWTLVLLAIVTLLAAIAGGATLKQQQANAAGGYDINQWGNEAGSEAWQNGNLNENNSEYHEGDSVAFRAILDSLTAGDTYVLRISFDALEGNNHAYDYITAWNRTEPLANPCLGITCPAAGTGLAIPEAPNGPAFQDTGMMSIWGGNITDIDYTSAPPLVSGTVSNFVEITFEPTGDSAVIAWGGHIATVADWPPPATTAVIDTQGSPYHMRLEQMRQEGNIVASGNQDRSLKASAVIVTPTLTLAKSSSAETVAAGGTFNWIVTVTVAGNETTAAQTITDTLPPGFTVNAPITDAVGPGGDANDMTCTAGGAVPGATSFSCTLAAGAPIGTYTITVPTKAPANFPQSNCGLRTNTVMMTGADLPQTLTATDDITVNMCANPNVGVTKSNDAPSGVVPSGGTFNWIVTATVTQGPTVASATINDTLPAGFTGGVPTFSVGGGGTPGLLSCGAFAGQAVSCTLASGAANGTYIITIPVTAPVATAQQCAPTDHTNTATVSGGGGTNTPPSATNSVDTACPNVSVTKVAGPTPVNVGSPVQFTVTVTNHGPGVASNVVVSDTLSNKADWDIVPAVAGCAISGTAFSNEVLGCTFATMASGEVKTIILVGATRATPAPNSCGTIPNSVSITVGNEATGNTSDNAAGPVNVVVNCPALSVVKSANPVGPVPVGSDIGFDIVVTNSGNAPATGVTVNDVLPTKPGLVYSATATTTFANPNTSSGTCGVAANTLTCSGINLAVGQSVTIHVTATTSGATTTAICGLLTNTDATATVGGVTSTSGSASVTITCPDLSIAKTANPAGPVVAGDDIGFDLTVTNAGPANATNVTVSDTLPTPSGVTWSTASPGCVIVVNVLTCSNQTVNVGVPLVIHVTGDTTAVGASRTCGVISNDNASATVFGETDTSGSASVTVNCPNPAIDKTGNGPISAGDTVVYTIVVTAGGTGPQNVVLNDTMPGVGLSWTLGGPDASGCVPPPPGPIPSGSSITCTWNNLVPGNTRTITLSAVSNPTMCSTPLENRVAITSPGDVDTGNNTDSASVTINCPNVTLTKTADLSPVNAGDSIGFVVTASNAGPGVAKSFVINDPLPGIGTNWSIQSQNPANSCAITGAVGSQVLRCPPAGSVDLASAASITVHVISPTTALTCGLVSNTASATMTNGGSLNATASVTVNCPNITVLKTADNGTISAGDAAAFTILVQNVGVGTAKGATLNDTLPPGITWVQGAPVNPFCNINLLSLSCVFPDMPQNASQTIHVTGPTTAANCGVLENTATVAATNESAAAAADGNLSTARISVNCADISIVKTPDAPTVNATDPVGYTITVTNTGTGIARDVTVTDTLPTNAGLSWTISPAVTGCAINAGVLTCTFGDLAPAATKSVHITSPTTVGTCPVIDNLASVTTSNDGSGSSPSRIVVNCPNVTVQKSLPAGQAPVVSAGDPVSFQIVVSVSGQGTAYNVTTSDPLPATTSGWSVTTNPLNPTTNLPACGIILNQLTCNFGNVAAGTTFTIVVSGNAIGANNQVTCDTITNTATVGAGNESNTQDNTSTATIGVSCPNIVIGKTTSTGVISAGDVARYRITVTNTGAGTATNVIVSDSLPGPGLTWTINPPVPGCAIVASVLSCSGNGFASMAPGASIFINVETTTNAAVCGVLSNRAFASASNDTLPGAGQVESGLVIITVDCPDVTVVKTADNSSVNAGDTAAFTILVTNNGPGTARNVTLSDPLPAGTNWTEGHADCTIAAGVLSCSFGDMIDDATELVHVSGATTSAQCGTLTNVATVAATNEAAAQQGNNVDGAQIVVDCPDVTVVKTAVSGTINAGEVASFTIVVSNVGLGTARNVILNDALPAGPVWTENSDQCSIAAGILSCNFGDLAPGQSVVITVSAQTTPAQCGTLVNTATVSASNEAAAQQGNNSSSAAIDINCPDILVVKTPDGETVSAGSLIDFVISVTNLGPGAATNVLLTDTLPAGFSWSEGSDDCSIAAGILSCNFGTLAPQEFAFVTVSAPTTAAQCGLITNTATASATNEAAGATANNTDSGTATIECPDVEVTKVASEDQVDPGESAVFTITVTSNGPGTANDVTLTDTLPAGITWSEDNAACGIAAGVLECDFGDMAPEATEVVTLTGEVSIAQCGTLTNTATISATNEPDTALANNSSTDSLVVACGMIQIIKIDQVAANNPNRPVDGDWDFTVTGPNQFSEERAIIGSETAVILNVPLGNGYGATEVEAIFGACPVPNEGGAYRTTVNPGGTQNLTEPGQTITFTFTNRECDVVLSTGLLVIEKVEDLNGNHIKDGADTMLSSWPVTVTGPEFPGGQQFLTDANGRITLPGILTGTYTVTEGTNSGFTVVGVVTDDNAPVFTASATTSTALAFQDTDTITFFNQPRGSITVHKVSITSHNGGLDQAAPNDDDGWVITLTSASCSINLQAVTDANGNATFENLPICNDYVVSENPVNAGSPGFSPVGPASQSNVSPGVRSATAVTFTNRRATFDPPCPACNPVTTPTPTPTRTPTPTNTPTPVPSTATPTPSPTRTPVSIQEGSSVTPTPIAPKTGEGFGAGPVSGANLLLVLIGLATIAGGLFFVGAGRRKAGNR